MNLLRISRQLRSPAPWVLVCIGFAAVASNVGTQRGLLRESQSLAAVSLEAASSQSMLREGLLLAEMVGSFRLSAERIQFVERGEAHRSFRCLENLMLQRVHQVIADEASESAWIVSGRITEFRGENFFLVEMARRAK
jgi:hypothetical protein